MGLIFYTSLAKGLKLKARKFRGLISTFAEVTEQNLVEGRGIFAPHTPILNMVNIKKNTDLIRTFEETSIHQIHCL